MYKNTPYLAHTFLCNTLEHELQQIRIWALDFPNEKLVVNIRADRWHAKQFNDNINLKLVCKMVYKYLSKKNIVINSDKAPFNKIFKTKYKELASGAQSPEAIPTYLKAQKTDTSMFFNYNMAATRKTLTKMFFNGGSLIEYGKKSRAIYEKEAIKKPLYGVMFDGF